MERDTLDAMARQGEGGSLALAAVPTFATRWLMPRLPGFAALQPDVVVHIETRTRPFLFADAEFDAALYAGTPAQVANWAGTRALLLLHEDVVPVCSPALLAARQGRDAGRRSRSCRCCSRARGPTAGASGSMRSRSTRRTRAAGRATSCSRCWRRPPRTASAWR